MNEPFQDLSGQPGVDSPAPVTADEELLAALADDFALRLRRGGHPTVEEYVARHPALAERIRNVLSAAAMMEQTRSFGVAPVGEGPGTIIGHYKLLERIGEGGFGIVYMAEQQQPVRRKVALKVIKPGVDSRQVIARFEAERQALALMDHENIAKVLDAGATDSGRPYFVMELVHGVPITEYCDKSELPPRERLELFVQVCRAVQHAHTKGIIHRDIKPTNVMVTLHEGVPVPKVIDFGVAKATGQQLTEKTLFTQFAQMVGTPLYMSPEQAEMTSIDVDTRSDVYSLGVLVYELLTGTTPLDGERLKRSAFDEVRRIIREEEPPRPSTRLSTLGEQAKSISARRKSDAAQLGRLMRGELDWIIMKCLEKDRNRRYETAISLAHDVDRYLRDEPVQACPPGATYRLRKFARRNWAALAIAMAVAAAVLLLIVGLAVSNRMIAASRNETAEALRQKELALAAAEANAEEANVQRQRAEDSTRKALTAVRDLLISPAISHAEWRQIPAPLRRKFRDEADRFYASLPQGGDTDAALLFENAVGQRALGYLYQQSDGAEQAESLVRQSVEILEGLHRESPRNIDYRQQLAWSHFTLFEALWSQRQLEEAEASAQRAIDLYEGLMALQVNLSSYTNEVYAVYLSMGHLLGNDLGRPDDAERMYQRAIAFHEQHAARVPAEPFTPSERVKAYDALAGLHLRAGRKKEAADFYGRALKVASDDPRRWYGAAALYLSIGEIDRYRGASLQLLDHAEKLAATNPNVADWAAKTCALSPNSVADFSRAERLAERCMTGTENHVWRRNFVLAKALTDYRCGRHEETIGWLEQFAPKPDGDHFDATAFAALALAHHYLGHNEKALASLDSAHAIIARKPPGAMASVLTLK